MPYFPPPMSREREEEATSKTSAMGKVFSTEVRASTWSDSLWTTVKHCPGHGTGLICSRILWTCVHLVLVNWDLYLWCFVFLHGKWICSGKAFHSLKEPRKGASCKQQDLEVIPPPSLWDTQLDTLFKKADACHLAYSVLLSHNWVGKIRELWGTLSSLENFAI